MTAMDDFNPAPIEAEVRAAFDDYEHALLHNDIDRMDAWFWPDERLVRFGIADMQHGAAEVAAWRRTAPGVPANRAHQRVTVTAFDDRTAIVALEFANGDEPRIGRQSQVWRRFPAGWRVVHAHVSMVIRDAM
jgi:hypothetical protein